MKMKKIFIGVLFLLGFQTLIHQEVYSKDFFNDFNIEIEKSKSSKVITQVRFRELDKFAYQLSDSLDHDMIMLSKELICPSINDEEKLRLIFSWIAFNVKYGFNVEEDDSAEGIFKWRKGVCEGYSNLFVAMCKLAGIEAVKIYGYAKGSGYYTGKKFKDTDHAWNSVYLNGRWRLIDVTWAGCYDKAKNWEAVTNREFNDYWFDTPPDEFIFTHMPDDDKWQFLTTSIKLAQFEQLHNLSSEWFRLGFDAESCMSRSLNEPGIKFPSRYSSAYFLRESSAPLERNIVSGRSVKFEFESDQITDFAIVSDNKRIHLKKNGSHFYIEIKPKTGSLYVIAKHIGERSYSTLLRYKVISRWSFNKKR